MPTFSQQRLGFIYGLSAYMMWGLFPLYFYLLRHIASFQVLTQRIIWCCILVCGVAWLMGRWTPIQQALRSPSLMRGLILSSLLVSANWLIFIWAIGQGRMLECSLGYFLTPLVSVLVARVFLNEPLDRYRWIAVALAIIGVAWLVVSLGQLPWVSISLAVSFGLYGLVRKKLPVDSLTGLALETLFLLPIALLYAAWLSWNGTNQFLESGGLSILLLIGSGAVTALPLILFANATQRLSLTAVGFMMYINPTMQFLIAIYVFKEPFVTHQLISFGFIWAALTVFSIGALQQHKRSGAYS